MDIKLYTGEHCPVCEEARDFFVNHKIDYEEVDVEKHPEAARNLYERCGSSDLPLIDIGGKCFIGFDRNAIKEELRLPYGR